MLILLPPSEGKTRPDEGGGPVDLDSLVFAAELGPSRRALSGALLELCAGPVDAAVAALGISTGQSGEVARDGEILASPAGPAAGLYTGVLYDRLDFGSLSPDARQRAERTVLIASGLWGLSRPGDRIPYYRFSMKPRLPGIGSLAGFWRPAVAAAMEAAGHDQDGDLILDLRSGAYSAVWKPRRARLLTVRAFAEKGGKRRVISHMAKAVRGEVARIVLEAPTEPADAESVTALIDAAGHTVEPGPRHLDVIVPSK